MGSGRGWGAVLLLLFAAACTLEGRREGAGAGGYDVTIRRDGHGVPHIVAADFGSLGYGEGYAFAQDHACTVADQVVRARGERARYFGRGEQNAHLASDIVARAFATDEAAGLSLEAAPPEMRAMVAGYADGYNRYLAETPVDRIPGWCRGEPWVRPISVLDLARRGRFPVAAITEIATAAPPGAAPLAAAPDVPDGEEGLTTASNAWAIGAERSAGGRGMLFANPHWFWTGSGRFWEKHLTVPGDLDVYGVNSLGLPGVGIGFNRDVAWTHTVSTSRRVALYTLKLVPGEPTAYLYDGVRRPMETRAVTVDVRQPDGSLTAVTRTVYLAHYGPVVNIPGVGWTAERAVAYRDVNAANLKGSALYLAMGRARSLAAFQQAHAAHGGPSFINTIAASADGRAWYADGTPVPDLSPDALAVWMKRRETDAATRNSDSRGAILLDGSDSRFEWSREPEPRGPGLVPFARAPRLERRDYVFNANDSAWVPHATERLTGYSPAYGPPRTPLSLRSRMNVRLLADTSPTGPAGADGKFSLDELGTVAFDNRGLASELLRPPLVERCTAQPRVIVDGAAVDLAPACRALAEWNGRLDLNSRGAVLWREFITRFEPRDQLRTGGLFAEDFDPERPIDTPRGLAGPRDGRDHILEALGHAVRVLERAGLPLDVPLGQVQRAPRGTRRVPVHGGHGFWEGVPNFVNRRPHTTTLEPQPSIGTPVTGSRMLTSEGYPVTGGTSFVMVLEFTDRGPRARALLVSGQTGDQTSPRFWEQTELYAAKRWREVRFSDEEIRADPGLTVTTLRGYLIPTSSTSKMSVAPGGITPAAPRSP
jgi:acyl-homoserine-lactone acylase